MQDPARVPSQAEAMMKRVSPEGRARALKEQRKRQREQMRIVTRCLLASILVAVALAAVNAWLMPVTPLILAAAVAILAAAWAGIGYAARPRRLTAAHLSEANLAALPGATAAWLEAQRPALPPPAVNLVDRISARLEAMTPQLATLDPREPAAESVRRLLSTELPRLIDHYRTIPDTLRAESRDGGVSPDARLVDALGIAETQIGRMTEQLAAGAFDELATQHRFLELKYEGDSDLSTDGRRN
jgi:hypothetical protein